MRLSILAQRRRSSSIAIAAEYLRDLGVTELLRAVSISLGSQSPRPAFSVRVDARPFPGFTLPDGHPPG